MRDCEDVAWGARGKHRTQKLLAAATELSLLPGPPGMDLTIITLPSQLPVKGCRRLSREEGAGENPRLGTWCNVLVNQGERGEQWSIVNAIGSPVDGANTAHVLFTIVDPNALIEASGSKGEDCFSKATTRLNLRNKGIHYNFRVRSLT